MELSFLVEGALYYYLTKNDGFLCYVYSIVDSEMRMWVVESNIKRLANTITHTYTD